MRTRHVLIACLLTTLILPVTNATAALITLNAQFSGNYHDLGTRATDGNFRVSKSGIGSGNHRNYFVFDLSGITPGSIVSATLTLDNPTPINDAGTTTIRLFDVERSISSITTSLFSIDNYLDLGQGVVYGSLVLDEPQDLPAGLISIPFVSPDGINALNAAAGNQFAIGGALTSTTTSPLPVTAFSGTNIGSTRQLILNTSPASLAASPLPEPASLAIFGMGTLGMIAGERRRRQKRVASC